MELHYCRREDCNRSVNPDDTARQYGIEDSVYKNGYCSVQCFTKDVMEFNEYKEKHALLELENKDGRSSSPIHVDRHLLTGYHTFLLKNTDQVEGWNAIETYLDQIHKK